MGILDPYPPAKDAVRYFINTDSTVEEALQDARSTYRRGQQQLKNDKQHFIATANEDHKAGFEFGRHYGQAELSLENMARTVPELKEEAPRSRWSKQRYPSKRAKAATTRANEELDLARVARKHFEDMTRAMKDSQAELYKQDQELLDTIYSPPPYKK